MLKYAQSVIHFTQDSRELHLPVVLLISLTADTELNRINAKKERLSQEDESVNIVSDYLRYCGKTESPMRWSYFFRRTL